MMKKDFICVIDSAQDDFLPRDLMERLHSLLPGLVKLPIDRAWDKDPHFFQRHKPRILITGWGAPTLPESRADLHGLELVCHLAGSVRGLVPRSLIQEGLTVVNWGNCHAPTVAECALMLALCCLRRVTSSQLAMHVDRTWNWPDKVRPMSLYKRKVGIHGFGAVARSLVALLRPFEVEIRAYSEGVPNEIFAQAGVQQAESLEDLFSYAEVLFELEAASMINIGSVTESHLRMLSPSAVLVNVGRAAVIDQSALERVACEGNLQIGLDVYHQEPLPADSPLRGLRNVCLLGHQAGPTPDRRCDCGEFALQNIQAFLSGDPLKAVVDLIAYDRST